MSTKTIFKLIPVFFIAILFTACSFPQNYGSTPTQNITYQPYNNNESEEIVSEAIFLLPADPTSLDPHRQMDILSAETEAALFNRLTFFYDYNVLTPYLAYDFYQYDLYTWVFHLRQGITFHDGQSFNAEAVYINFERIMDPYFSSPRMFLLNVIDYVQIIDEYTVHFVTHFPFSPLPYTFAHSPVFVSPNAILEERNGGLTVAENPIGTGPFMLYNRIYGDVIELVRFNDFFRGTPNIERLTYRIIPDAITRLLMIENGEAHVTQVSPTDAQILQTNPNIYVYLIDSTRTISLGFNNSRPPFNNTLLRQAVSYSIDKEEILYGIVEGFGKVGTGPVSPVIQGGTQDLNIRTYNIERARELVIQAGYEDGLTVTMYTNDGNPIQAMIMQYLQTNLAQIGITVELQLIEWGAFLELTANGVPDMFLHGWSTTTGDADYGIYMLFHGSVSGSGGNRAHFNSPFVNTLLDTARETTYLPTREAIYAQISQYLVDEAVSIFLYYPTIPIATQGIENLFIDFNGTSYFHRAIVVN